MTTFELPDDIDLDDSPVDLIPAYQPGSRAACPKCGKECHVNADGTLRAHTCGDVKVVRHRSTTGKGRKKRSTDVPGNVKRLGTAAIASGVEWGAARYIASVIPCDPKQIPPDVYEVTDPDDMVGPLVKLLWPQIPAKAQQVIGAICDQEDLIVCAFAWIDYAKRVDTFAREMHKQLAASQSNTTGGVTNVVPIQTQRPTGGSVLGVELGEPFQPDTASGETL